MNDMPWVDVKYMLEKAGYSLSSLARKHRGHATEYAHAKDRCVPKQQTIIAKVLGKEPQELWPSRYIEGGVPLNTRTWQARLYALKHASNLPRPRKKSNIASPHNGEKVKRVA